MCAMVYQSVVSGRMYVLNGAVWATCWPDTLNREVWATCRPDTFTEGRCMAQKLHCSCKGHTLKTCGAHSFVVYCVVRTVD